jgi:hypothetical protein
MSLLMQKLLARSLMLGGERLVHVFTSFYVVLIDRRIRWPMRRCTGTIHSRLCAGGFETGDIVWFPEGGLNAPYNCVDCWAFKHPNNVNTTLLIYSQPYAVHQITIIYEANEPRMAALSLMQSYSTRSAPLQISSKLLVLTRAIPFQYICQ